jgi:hypothetical protein
MNKCLWFAMVPALLFAKVATAQYPAMNMITDDLVQKYQQASCEQLWEQRATKQGHPKSQRELEAVRMLHGDPQMRAAFIDRVAACIANKMFECGMISLITAGGGTLTTRDGALSGEPSPRHLDCVCVRIRQRSAWLESACCAAGIPL